MIRTSISRTTLFRTSIALIAAVALFTAPASLAADSLDEVLANYYEAVGGKDAWSKIENVKVEGSMSMMGTELPYTVWTAEPSKMRLEFEMQGMKGIQAIDGDSGWMVMPFMGSDEPEPMPAEMVEAMSADAGVSGPLFDYEDKGHTIELVGDADVEGTRTHHLKVTMANGRTIDYFLDAEYYVPIQQKMMVNAQGQEFEAVIKLSDYKEVGGIMVPFTTTQSSPMGEQVMTTKSIEANVDLPDGFFAMPEGAGE